MKLSILIIALVLTISALGTTAQVKKPILDNQKIIDMTKAKVDKMLIITAIRTQETNFDLSSDGLIQLKKGKVKREIVALMQEVDDTKRRVAISQRSAGNLVVVDPDEKSSPSATLKKTPTRGKGFVGKQVPIVKGKAMIKTETVVFGESYPDSMHPSEGVLTFERCEEVSKGNLKGGNTGQSGRTGQ